MRSRTTLTLVVLALFTLPLLTASAVTAPDQFAVTAKALQSAVTTAPAPPTAVATALAAAVLAQPIWPYCPWCGLPIPGLDHTMCPQCLMVNMCPGLDRCHMCTSGTVPYEPRLPRCYVQWVYLDALFGEDEWVPGVPDACACFAQDGYMLNTFITDNIPGLAVLVKWVGQSHHFSGCSLGEEHNGNCNGEVVFVDLDYLVPPPPPDPWEPLPGPFPPLPPFPPTFP